jgi:hypothetical protein
MFCMQCGRELPPNAVFCPNCGQKAETISDAHGETAPAMLPVPPQKIDCGLGLAIVAVLMGQLPGIVGLVYSVLAIDMLHKGDYESARRAAHTGKVWSWSIIILSSLVICLGLLVFLFGMILMTDGSARSSAGDYTSQLMEMLVPGLTELLK